MRPVSIVLALVAALSLSLFAQQEQTAKACISSDAQIFKPGVDGVKPPQPKSSRGANDAPSSHGPFSVEIVVSDEGHVCSVRLLSAKDQLAARKAADYIAEHWTFQPATKDGKPVAVSFTINFTNLNPR